MERKDTIKSNTDEDNKKEQILLPPTKNESEISRIYKLLQTAGTSNVGELMKKFKPIIDITSDIINKVAPYFIITWTYILQIYNIIPEDILMAILGLCLAFFGGVYVLTIAAAETFILTGWEGFNQSFSWLKQNFDLLWEKSREDDKKDENGDGIADILQISARELFSRKVAFFFSNCSDPQKLMDMLSVLCTSVISVIAVLKIEFAKTIALGTTIGESLRKPAAYFIVPVASTAIPKDYHQWIAPAINLLCKCVAVSIAWFIQIIISSVQTAIRGGLLFSRRTLHFLNDKGYIQFNDEDSYLDEIIGWTVALFGVYYQLTSLFSVPFPFNVLLLPLTIVENYLSWIIA